MKRNLILIAIIIFLSIALVIIKKTDKTYKMNIKVKKPFEALNKDMIAKISIKQGKKEVIIKREKDGFIVNKYEYPADESLINGLINNFKNVTILNIASRNSRKLKEFSLDEKNRKVVEFIDMNGNLMKRVYIGKNSFDLVSTYFKFPDGERVFLTNTNLKYICSNDPDYWIKKELLSLKSDDIKALNIIEDTVELKLEYKEGWKMLKPLESNLRTSEVKQLFNNIVNLQCIGIEIDKKKDSLEKLKMDITIKASGKENIKIKIYKGAKNYEYVMISGIDKIFKVNSYKIDSIKRNMNGLILKIEKKENDKNKKETTKK